MADVQRFLRANTPERYRLDPANPIVNPISFGDLLVWDKVNRFVKRHVAGSALKFVGAAMGRFPISSNVDHNTGPSSIDTQDGMNVFDRGLFFYNTTAAETYEHGDPVKLGADAQTISKATQITDQDLIIGSIWKPLDSAATT